MMKWEIRVIRVSVGCANRGGTERKSLARVRRWDGRNANPTGVQTRQEEDQVKDLGLVGLKDHVALVWKHCETLNRDSTGGRKEGRVWLLHTHCFLIWIEVGTCLMFIIAKTVKRFSCHEISLIFGFVPVYPNSYCMCTVYTGIFLRTLPPLLAYIINNNIII